MIRNIKERFNSNEVYDIYSLCMYFPTKDKFNKKAVEYMSNINIQTYGFFSNNILAGVIVVKVNTDKTAEIIGIAVKHLCQNKGIGRQLIEYSITKNSIFKLVAETDDDAVLFYNKCGFQTEEFYKLYYENSYKRYKCTLFTN